MTTQANECDDVQSLIQRLSEAAGGVEKDDLGGLAKMHTWCESLADTAKSAGASPPPQLVESVRKIVELLEQLILGETEDADASLASIVEQVGGLASLAGSGGAASCVQEATGQAPASDDAVEEKLARVFDEEPPAGETPSAQADPPTDRDGETTAVEAAQADDSDEGRTSAATVKDAEASEDGTPVESEVSTDPPYEQLPLTIDEKELEFVKGFVEEAGEHIEAVEAAVLEVERAPDDAASIDNLFRPFHTIKGMAGFLNLRDINCLTHEVETLMDQGRKGKRQITPGLIDLIFDVVDILKVQIGAIASHVADPKPEEIPQPPVVEMIEKLRAVVAGRIEPEGRQPSAGSPGQKIGENLVDQGACAREVVDFALERQRQKEPAKKTGEIITDAGAATARQVGQALRAQKQPPAGAGRQPAKAAAADQSVRIDTLKLDSLVDMVGELVIAQTLVGANSMIAGDAKLSKDVSQASKIVRDVQELAMAMRMIPIGSTFHKMARLVRDVSRKAGKHVELHISGEETELDKNVIQQIGDPLVHMVRNAVDHGIESPQERRAAGKDEAGHVYLSAFHQGGNIVIEIRDDGKGLDPKTLIAKGIEKGIVQPGEELTDQQAFHLVFAAGFSTAAQVTDISGRGVGMDVVRRNIEQLRGKVDISSELGKGSTFSLRLPLTLAIIDGMVITVGGERFIIPTIAIEQALRPKPEMITTVQHKGEVLNVRGRLIPLIQLGTLFGLTERIEPWEAMVVIAHCEDHQIGLVVGELLGQQQVVIKTLGERFQGLRGISGAAILGDGRVGLILETSGLALAHNASLPRPPAEPSRNTAAGRGSEAVSDPPSTVYRGGENREEEVLVTA